MGISPAATLRFRVSAVYDAEAALANLSSSHEPKNEPKNQLTTAQVLSWALCFCIFGALVGSMHNILTTDMELQFPEELSMDSDKAKYYDDLRTYAESYRQELSQIVDVDEERLELLIKAEYDQLKLRDDRDASETYFCESYRGVCKNYICALPKTKKELAASSTGCFIVPTGCVPIPSLRPEQSCDRICCEHPIE